MTQPKISMIVSNLNGLQLNLLKDCINSLTKPIYSNWELIIVDNASTDESVRYLKRRLKKWKNCSIIENSVNIYSQGLNLGAKKATGKYLAYFNNDVAISKDYLTNIVKELEKDNKIAIAQGKLLNFSSYEKIDSAGETMDIFGNPVTIGFGERDKEQYNHQVEILSASGSACVIKKKVFNKIGGYDPIYGIGYEDMDLALRARRAGYKIKRIPNAIIYHKRAATDSADFIKVNVKWHFNKNRLITMIKNYPLSLLLITLPVTIFLYLLITLYEWFIHKNWKMGWVRFTSIIWVLFNFPSIIRSRQGIKLKYISEKELRLFSSISFSSQFELFKSIG